MKKRPVSTLKVLVTAMMIISLLALPAQALDPQPEPPMITILIDGSALITDVSPIIQNGRTLVPLRAIFEALGAEVFWNGADRSIKAIKGDLTVQLQIGNTTAIKNGAAVQIDVPPQILQDRTLVPVRFVSEALGADVQWDQVFRRVTIISAGSPDSTPPDSQIKPLPIIPPINITPGNNFLRIVDTPNLDILAPKIRLSNGKLVPLTPKGTEEDKPLYNFQTRFAIPGKVRDHLQIIPPQATVDHRQFQTTIKDQAGRNTCVSFAVLAAMEAAYKGLDPVKYHDIDLSEQYAHLMQKMVFLADAPPSNAALLEDQLGRWGFGNTLYSMALFAGPLAVPGENLLPYITGGSYEDTNEAGDNPRINPANVWLTQKAVSDINLAETEFPQAALNDATYGISSYSVIPADKITDVNYFKAVLAAGYDIAFSAKILTPDPTPEDGIWNPGSNHIGNHAMLMVGYDDVRQVFIVKNSWGFDNILENGFTLFDFDWVTSGLVTRAGYITGVIPNPSEYTRPEQRFLGRWNLDHDGWKGVLDIYHLPGFFQDEWPRDPALFGNSDKRIGTYYHENGTAYRVNGSITGNRIEFYIDFDNPNMKYDEIRGKRFIGYLFGWEPTLMAGSMASDGEAYGFYATKEDYLQGSGVSGEGIKPSDFAGVWEMNHDGWQGTLTISSINLSNNAINASYLTSDGQTLPVSGYITQNRHIQMNISFASGHPQAFSGCMFSWEKGLMSGSTPQGGSYYGWVARRIAAPPLQIVPDIEIKPLPIKPVRMLP